MSSIGVRLKKIRTEKHLTQEALGKIIGVSKQAVANVESSHSNPSVEFMSKLFDNLDVNLNWFICGSGQIFNAPKFEQVEGNLTQMVEDILRKNNLIK